ncbi:unnamed protein product [Angiostrongylus costaricensis]|uniref:NAB co-repressor domain-containing protein n=1 Tax=Angiostrongylus costaricensis TaxID=334426 RepID=A0A158PK08_ANGCS|nr:unnamed protein product [Angiostrongylus costaricensis]
MSSSDGNNTPSPSSVASSSQQQPLDKEYEEMNGFYGGVFIRYDLVSGLLLSALPTSSSSQLQIPAVTKNSMKRESPQLKAEGIVRTSTPKTLTPPTSISEWQLLAVLQRANLVQYYDMFISQGKNNETCKKPITSVTTNSSKCLGVTYLMHDGSCPKRNTYVHSNAGGLMKLAIVARASRLMPSSQRQLVEFSKDQTTFNLAAIQHIGPPPVSPYALGGPDMSFLMPGFAATLTNLSSTSPGLTATSTENTSPQNGNVTHNSVPLAIELSAAVLGTMATSVTINNRSCVGDFSAGSAPIPPAAPGGTANVVRGEFLPAFGQGSINVTGEEKERSSSPLSIGGDFVSLGDYDPNTALCDSPVLSDAQIRRLSTCAMAICQKIPRLPPKLVQNKKRVSKEVLDLLSASADAPNRLADYRKYSAIYGRFDAKRKPDKTDTLVAASMKYTDDFVLHGLSFHEVSVNEAAAQLCLIMPSLLTRRDELFPLARQVVKDAGYHYAKASRKRGLDHIDSHSPQSSPTYSPCLGDDNDVDVDSVFGSSTVKQSDEKRKKSDTDGEEDRNSQTSYRIMRKFPKSFQKWLNASGTHSGCFLNEWEGKKWMEKPHKAVTESAMQVIAYAHLGSTIRQCSCAEDRECVKSMEEQYYRPCNAITNVGLSSPSCVKTERGPQIPQVDLRRLFTIGEQQLNATSAEVLNSDLIANIRCQPLITKNNLRSALRSCLATIDWKQSIADLCHCAQDVGFR